MGRRLWVACAVVLLAVAGCTDDDAGAPAATPAPTAATSAAETCKSSSDMVTIGDTRWSYDVQVPPGARSTDRLPVVYLLHGLGGGAGQIAAYSGFDDAAVEHGFVLVTPQANGLPSTWDLVGPTDLEFLRTLIGQVPGTTCVDPDRQFVAGFSNGSAMTFLLACEGDLPIRAYGGVSAAGYEGPRCDDAPPASIVYVHGTADEVVPYGGGSTPLLPVEPVETTMAQWARHDGCAAEPERSSVAEDVRRWRWSDCADGSRVDTYVVEGGGHTWPGSQAQVPFLGVTTQDLDATATMVEFFGLDD